MTVPVLFSLCLSLATISLSAKGAEFSQERDLPPLTLRAADLDNICSRLNRLLPRPLVGPWLERWLRQQTRSKHVEKNRRSDWWCSCVVPHR